MTLFILIWVLCGIVGCIIMEICTMEYSPEKTPFIEICVTMMCLLGPFTLLASIIRLITGDET
jgi:hypothetical protein